jgi:membrane-associated phospholipid phosphatase
VIRQRLLVVTAASAVLAVISGLFVDQPLARWIAGHEQSSLWNPVVKVLEYLAGISPWDWTVPIVLVGGALITLAVARWRHRAHAWMYIALVYLLARNLMGWGKTLSGRLRPHQWVHVGGAMFGHRGEGASFPSGHVTLFGGLIIPLVVAVPRLRLLLLVLPFIMVARIAVQAHFASDVFAGLALTTLVAWVCAPVLTMQSPVEPAAAAAPASR